VTADDDGFVIEDADEGSRRFAYAEIERARTVFEWGTAARPGAGERPRRGSAGGRGTDRKRVTTP
jgi:hypothetical protein